MDDLVSWLRAQLDDDERVAREAAGHVDPEQCEHIARWDPTRVLAEIDAKRRIMDGLDIDINGEASPWRGCGDDCEFKAIYWAVQVLALPYADRAGYREEWRP